MVGIYKITNPNGGIYIGQSWDMRRRHNKEYKSLRCKTQRKLYHSFKKYGFSNHLIEVIYEFPNDIKQCVLDEYEGFAYSQYKEAGFNMLNLQSCGRNKRHSEETKKIISENSKRNFTPEVKAYYASLRLGKKYSDETRKRISEALTGKKYPNRKKLPPESVIKAQVTKQKKANERGYWVSEETKRKISESKKGIKPSKEHTEKRKNGSQEIRNPLSNRFKTSRSLNIILDLETGIFYMGALEASNAKGITRRTLSRWLLTKDKKTSLIYV